MAANIRDFSNRRILVAGEVGIDEYIEGDVTRISPEAPVPVVEVRDRFERLGLAANVAQNITSLGGKVSLLSLRGRDADGERIEAMLGAVGVDRIHFVDDDSRPTLRKVRVLSGKQHIVRFDYERTHRLHTEVATRFRDRLCELLDECDGVILQDYGKGLWNPDVMGFVSHARKKAKPVFVDPSRLSPLKLYRGTTLLTPNVQEAVALCGLASSTHRIEGNDDEALAGIARRILDETEAEHAVITCGAHGMVSMSRKDPQFRRIPTFAREVFDVTGAGDTVIAVMALSQVRGDSLAESMRAANAAAGLVVGRIGTATVTPDELEAALATRTE